MNFISINEMNAIFNNFEKQYENFKYMGCYPLDFNYLNFDMYPIEYNKLLADNIHNIVYIINYDIHTEAGKEQLGLYINLLENKLYYIGNKKYKIPKEIKTVIKEIKTLVNNNIIVYKITVDDDIKLISFIKSKL